MSPWKERAEEQSVEKIAQELRADGYEVIREPAPAEFPFDLGGYRPDLIARRGDEGLVIEIKASERLASVDQVAEAAEVVSHHTGWRFLLLTADRMRERTVADLVKLATPEEIGERSRIAEALIGSDNLAAGVLIAFSAIEALLRRLAVARAIPAEALSTTALVKQLYSLGALSRTQLEDLIALAQVRDAIAHGSSEQQGRDSTQKLLSLLHELQEVPPISTTG